jgi:hypothetical protein
MKRAAFIRSIRRRRGGREASETGEAQSQPESSLNLFQLCRPRPGLPRRSSAKNEDLHCRLSALGRRFGRSLDSGPLEGGADDLF